MDNHRKVRSWVFCVDDNRTHHGHMICARPRQRWFSQPRQRHQVQGIGQAHPPTRPPRCRTQFCTQVFRTFNAAPNAIAIRHLTCEAWDVKRQISANVERARERVIVDEREKLGGRCVTTVDCGSNQKRKRECEQVEVAKRPRRHHPDLTTTQGAKLLQLFFVSTLPSPSLTKTLFPPSLPYLL